MKLNIYKYVIFLNFCVSCTTNNISNITEYDKLGITISTEGNDTDSTLVLNFSLDHLVDSLPIITVNGKYPDTPYFDPLSFSFHNTKFNDSFFFQIIYKKDTIRNAAFIPGIIDSLFINGIYFSPEADYSSILTLNSSDSLHLYWKDTKKSSYYYIYIRSDFINPQIDKYISDSNLTLAIDPEMRGNRGDITININKWYDLNRWPYAAINSKELFIYYDLDGPIYNSYKQLLR